MRLNLPDSRGYCRLLLSLGYEAEIVDPELTTDGTPRRQAADVQHQQLAIVRRSEFASGRFPQSPFFQFVAVIEDCLPEGILHRKMKTALARLDFSILVKCG